MVHLMEDTNLCAIHARRVTISTWKKVSSMTARHTNNRGQGLRTIHAALPFSWRGAFTLLFLLCAAVPRDLQLARRIRGSVYGVSSN